MKNKDVKMLVLLVFCNQRKAVTAQTGALRAFFHCFPTSPSHRAELFPIRRFRECHNSSTIVLLLQQLLHLQGVLFVDIDSMLWDCYTAIELDVQTKTPCMTVNDLRGSNQIWHNLSNLKPNQNQVRRSEMQQENAS